MLKPIFVTASAVVITICLPTPASAQEQHATPASDGKVANWLEDRLGRVIESCLVGRTRIKMKKSVRGSKTASPIPQDLLDYASTPGNKEYWRLGSTGAIRIFGTVLSKNDVAGGLVPTVNKRLLSTDFLTVSRELLLRGNINYQTYEQSCTAAFSTAISVGGGLDSKTIQAAGEAATTGRDYKRADIAVGTFASPFTDGWNGPRSTSAQKFHVALLFWDWRRRNGNADGYLIPQFSGYAMHTATNKKLDVSASGNASGGFALPFLSMKAEVEGKYSDASELESKLFEAIATQPISRKVADHFALPSEADLIDTIKANQSVSVSHNGEGVLIGGLRQTSFVDVANMPSLFCKNRSDYEITGSLSSQLSVDSVVDKSEEGYCRFVVTYLPTQTSGHGSVDVPFNIHFRKQSLLSGMAGFEIKVEDLQYQWANVPKLQPVVNLLTLYARQPFGAGIEQLVWRSTGSIDDRNLLAPGFASVTNARLQDGCDVPRLVTKPDVVMVLIILLCGKIDYTMTITLRLEAHPSNNLMDSTQPTQDCAMSANIQYTVAGGRQITRPLADTVNLRLPAPPPETTSLVETIERQP